MRLIEPTEKPVEKDAFEKALGKFKQLLQLGKTAELAEDAIVARFMRGLDNRYTMLLKLQVEGMDESFPPILIGPIGLIVLNISQARGFFKAKEDTWWEMDKSTRRFEPARPNLIKQTTDYAHMLAGLLEAHGKPQSEIFPVLVFANPGVHVETTNPTIRIVLMDGIDSLITTLLESKEALPPTEVDALSNLFESIINPAKAVPIGEGEDFFGRDLQTPTKKPTFKLPNIPIPAELPPIEEKLKLSRKQWIILEVLMGFTILVLLAAIIYVLIVY